MRRDSNEVHYKLGVQKGFLELRLKLDLSEKAKVSNEVVWGSILVS